MSLANPPEEPKQVPKRALPRPLIKKPRPKPSFDPALIASKYHSVERDARFIASNAVKRNCLAKTTNILNRPYIGLFIT